MVAPLAPAKSVLASAINPSIRVDDRGWTLVISDLVAMPRNRLERRITNLETERRRIIAALDLLFTGV